ncbi:MAG: Group 3 truncated hemoglobin ctb [Flavobacteriales bacterium]|nr:Group 3 truncated hemoglobin ctb [Flavobacteriales bacterium]
MSTVAPADLDSADRIDALVHAFYARVRPDPVLGPWFTEVDWPHHIPRIQAFWRGVLLGLPGYEGDPMTAHIGLHRRKPLDPAAFDRWVALWTDTVRAHHAGPKAEEAIARAGSIAGVMRHRVLSAAASAG